MQLRFLATAAAVCLPGMALAQPISGLYVGAGALFNYKQAEHAEASPGAVLGSSRLTFSADGYGGLGSVGYGLGNGLRAEVEGDYRNTSVRKFTAFAPNSVHSSQQDYGVLGNVLYDIDLRPFGLDYAFTPYVGVGAGWEWSHLNGLNAVQTTGSVTHLGGTASGNFAYQGIVGFAFPIDEIPGLAVTADYRFLGVLGPQSFRATSLSTPGAKGNYNITENLNHSGVVGIRYAFNTPQPPPPPAPVPAPVAAPTRTYLVFFDWDRADLTDRARQIVAEAAQASTRVQATRIEVQGNADLSGTKQYNQKLSLRRAQTVAAELVRDGVPAKEIQIQAFGDTRPLVPTAPGVREPQNRRVAIILQ